MPGARLAVFVDACFWHGCPDRYIAPVANAAYWEAKIAGNQARDTRVDEELRAGGWTVFRVWEHELRDDLDGVVAKLHEMTAAARRVGARPKSS